MHVSDVSEEHWQLTTGTDILLGTLFSTPRIRPDVKLATSLRSPLEKPTGAQLLKQPQHFIKPESCDV